MFEIVQLCGRYDYRDTSSTKKAEDLPSDRAQMPSLTATAA